MTQKKFIHKNVHNILCVMFFYRTSLKWRLYLILSKNSFRDMRYNVLPQWIKCWTYDMLLRSLKYYQIIFDRHPCKFFFIVRVVLNCHFTICEENFFLGFIFMERRERKFCTRICCESIIVQRRESQQNSSLPINGFIRNILESETSC